MEKPGNFQQASPPPPGGGNSHHFLYQEQSARARARKSAPENNYQTIITGYSSCPEECVNFVLNPHKTYPDAFPEFTNERSVEHNLECLSPRSKDLVKISSIPQHDFGWRGITHRTL